MTTQPIPLATVRWAYRFLLGREPESEAIVRAWAGESTLHGLLEGMLGSQEIALAASQGFPARGSWIENEVSEEAAVALLSLRDGRFPAEEAVRELRERCASLAEMRRVLLEAPAIEARLAMPEGPRRRRLLLAGRPVTLHGDSREPEFLQGPALAPRLAALAAALLPGGGEGCVIVEAGAGIGVSTLAFAAGAPGHAALVAHEADLPRAAALTRNIVENGLSRAGARAVPMGDPAEMLAREGLSRLDLLRLAEPGATLRAPLLAPFLLARGAALLLRLDLGELIATAEGPRAALEACLAAFPHGAAFGPGSEPYLLDNPAAVETALRGALARTDRRDDILLFGDTGWMDRFGAL
ncbi:hypothetical protein [Roseococcus sp. YIM B11640]|uniref:hypothetical protein n=1 Tax=Roseococcus sp. YIM B11640 TaxID=3133973 RepID=UPI003C7C6B6D